MRGSVTTPSLTRKTYRRFTTGLARTERDKRIAVPHADSMGAAVGAN